MHIYHWNNLSKEEQHDLLARPATRQFADIFTKTQNIIHQVKTEGDAALTVLTSQYDQVNLTSLKVAPQEFEQATAQVDEQAVVAIKAAMQQITTYHQAQQAQVQKITTIPGIDCERHSRPIDSVGLYVPGGSAPLISTLLMLAIPAQLAGCAVRILCTPPDKTGAVDPHLLVAAALCNISHIYKIGGAQAIAAMAYGTQSVPKVDKIFGPGNAYVTAAKMQVSQDPNGASIDMPAGPSELLIIADAHANPAFVAADLLSQAEHGENSQVILLTESLPLATEVQAAVAHQLYALPRRAIAEQSLRYARIIIIDTLAQAFALSNRYAPEHLSLQIAHPEQYIPNITNAGAVFLGKWTPETMGDYITGSNHVLPTSGFARAVSGLSLRDFTKWISFQKVSEAGLQALAPYAEKLAELEGLEAHKRAVSIRLASISSEPHCLLAVDQNKRGVAPSQAPHNDEQRAAQLIRPDLHAFTPYSSARDEATTGKIWLNANELPWELPGELPGEFPSGSHWDNTQFSSLKLNRYPEKQPPKLLATLAEHYYVQSDQLVILRGSDEGIDLLIRLFCVAGKDAILICPPTFGMYSICAKLQGASIVEVPLLSPILPEKHFQLDVEQIINRWTSEVKLIFICSPNNPTANLIPAKDILRLCQHFAGRSMVVVDEAYIEFSDAESLSQYINQFDNLVILRTLSKAYGLAGVRCGLLLANRYIVNWINAIMAPYPLSSLTVQAVRQMLYRLPYLREKITHIKKERERMIAALGKLPFIRKVWPSASNFILAKAENSHIIMQKCLENGFVLRHMDDKLFLENCLRITIGTPEENTQLLDFFNTENFTAQV